MKTLKIPFLLLFFSILSFTTYNDILSKLGLESIATNDKILKNFIGDFDNNRIDVNFVQGGSPEYMERKTFQIPKAKNLSAIISGDKKAATLELCQYVKSYTESPEFVAEYQNLREKTKPTEEPYQFSPEEIKSMEEGIKAAEKGMVAAGAHLSADKKAEMKKVLQQQKDEIAKMKDPNPNKTKWEKMYPADPSTMVKNRLKEYLDLANTVDFNAATTSNGKIKKFVNPEYEKKSLKWKAIYRAGKEVNDVATVFVKNWVQTGVKTSGGR